MASSTTASEKRIIGWIEDMIDEPLSSTSDLSVALSDGVALCKLVNKIRDGIVPYINTNPGVLNHLENISAYLQACWTLGVPTESIFGTQDLINRRNIPAVIKNLDALASVTVSNESVATSLPPTLTATSLSSDCSPAGTKTSIQIDPNEDLIAENEELTEENQNLRNRVRKMQEAVEECEAIISDKDKEISDLTEKLEKVTEELHQAKDAISTNGHPVDPVELKARRLSRLESEIMTRGRANTELNNKVKHLEDENGKLQIEVVKLQQEMARLQTQDASATSISSCNDDTEPGSLPGTATREREKERDKAENTKDKIARRRSYAVSKPDGSPVATVTQDGEQGTSHYRHGMNLTPLSVSVPSSPSHSPSLSSSRHPPNKPLPLLPSHSSSSLASSSSSISSSSFSSSSLLYFEEHSLSSISSMPSRGDSDPNIISPRRRPETPQTPGAADPNKRKNLAARTFKGLKDKLGKKSARGEKVDQEDLHQEINAFSSSQKAYGLTPHSFDLLLYLVNASLQAMGEDTEHTDTIALQILMRSAFFFFKKDRGVVQFMHEHIREHDVWKRYVFWEEYFYSEIGNHAKLRKDDPKLVFSVLSEFLVKMRDFGVSAGLVQKLVNDVASKEEYKLTKEEVSTIMATSNPNPTTPTSVTSPTTVPVMLRHTFLQKSTKKPAWCDFCNEFVWAVARIVYSCSECKFTIHKKCLDECLPHSACSSKKTLVVGTPFDVAHKVNVTKNANGGYEGLPKEWQDILEQSGIDQSDVLANPHAVLHIMEYHTQQQRKVTDKILPTPNLRQNRPLPPLPPPRRKTIVSEEEKDTQREGEGEEGTKEETDIDPAQAAPIPGLEETEDIEPSQYAIDDIVTPDNPAALYRDITQIGQGANAEVFSGFSIKSGNKVAIKKIKWDASKSNALINEIQIMKSSIHSNVICCTDCFLFEGELWVIMEFVDYGSLTDILDQYPRGLQMNEPEIAFVCSQTLKALEYIHSQGIIHRDIKTDNILLGLDGRVLLADFGSAARLTPARPVRKTVIGSPYWMAPELIRGEEYSQKVDIFSLGCTLQELAVGEPPFSEFPPLKALFSLATSDVPPIKNEDKKWTPLFMDFFNKCVRKDPAMRPTATDLMMHPFLGVACKQEEFSHNVINKAISYRDSMLSVFG